MTDLLTGRADLAEFHGPCLLRRLLLRRRARRRWRLGQDHPSQRPHGRDVPHVLQPRGHLRSGHLQRLPDDEPSARPDPGRLALAGIRAQHVRAVRGSSRERRGSREPVDLLRGHGRQRDARRELATAKAACSSCVRKTPRSSKAAARFVDPCGNPTEVYPYNPNGSKGGLTSVTTEDGRFTIMMPHPERSHRAAAALLAPGRMDGRLGLDAHVPQRPQVGRLRSRLRSRRRAFGPS